MPPLQPLYPQSYFFQKDKNVRKQITMDPDVVETAEKKERREKRHLSIVYTAGTSEVDTEEEQEPLP